MRTTLRPTLCLMAALTLAAASCGRKETPVDATRPLQEAFQTAGPEVRQAIETVNTHLRAGDYPAAARALAAVVLQRQLTEPERHAVAQALEQINRGVAARPALDTKEMYELRAKMFQAIHRGGSRLD